MNKQIIPASTFNRLSAAEQLAALRAKTHNWGDYNATRALELGASQQRRFEAMVAKNVADENGEFELLWA